MSKSKKRKPKKKPAKTRAQIGIKVALVANIATIIWFIISLIKIFI